MAQNQIISNKVKCLVCDQIIESTHTHDFTGCRGGHIYVDGGTDYLRRVGDIRGQGTTWLELSEYEGVQPKECSQCGMKEGHKMSCSYG